MAQNGGFTALGAYPTPAKNPSPSSVEKGRTAAKLFAQLLEEGGHSVEVTERMDAVRYQKVEFKSCLGCGCMTDQAERVELYLVVCRRPYSSNTRVFRPTTPRATTTGQAAHS
jgi:hypothetical protein